MIRTIKIKKGLDIPLMGAASGVVKETRVEGIYSIEPQDFYGFKPKPVVKEGDCVAAGDPLFVNKEIESLKVVSPVSGKVVAVERGERRKLLSIKVEADNVQRYKEFGTRDVTQMNCDEVKALLLESGLFAFVHQRPFDIVANPGDSPRTIFVSAFNTMPLAQDFLIAYKGNEHYFQLGINALGRIAPVTLCLNEKERDTELSKTENAELYIIDGPNPSGNVGVQINHISPINKGEIVWTIGAEELIFIGKLLETGKVDLTRTIALAGSEVKEPSYFKAVIGMSLNTLLEGRLCRSQHIRIINGNPLVGRVAGLSHYLSARATEVTVIPEGDDNDEVLGWIMPRLNDFSKNRSYFSWLQGRKKYNLDARIKGGERHIIMSGEYDRVLPMDIYAGYLIKAILTADLDRMEMLGIYEVAPEDFAVAEFVDSSKLELQRIVREGLDLLRKELE